MFTHVFWIAPLRPARLGTMPRPRGNDWLDDEIAALRRAGVQHLVSALEPHEIRHFDLQREAECCRQHHIHFHHCPIPDRGLPPNPAAFQALITTLALALNNRQPIVTHCRMGIGRATLLAASVMIHAGTPADQALAWIEAARGRPVPDTPQQRQWLLQYTPHKIGS